nr:receptor-like protein kinase isoform X2 [Ziziphus jujuba var. spinosa]
MSKVLSLDLGRNQLSGEIPPSIGNCWKLQELFLDDNHLTGVLPESFTNLKHLTDLFVGINDLVGSIPSGLGSCSNLEYLDVAYNRISGQIPPSLGNCSSLYKISAMNNNLVGSIPSSFGQLDELSELVLSENQLSGKIPPELGNCKSLTILQLYSNRLEGEIPSELGMLTNLLDLQLQDNHLTGEIPVSIWKIQSLQEILVSNNSLSGQIPLVVTELKKLQNISLFNNHFFGIIPKGLGINSSLVQLDFTNNSFSGDIPPNLCHRKKLRRLLLGVNQLEGSMPSEVGSCPTLHRLILEQNKLTGFLPKFAKGTDLSYMDISKNSFSGEIPSSMGNCTNITYINLSMNKFKGSIPQELGNLINLQVFNLSHNNLVGPLPSQLSNCTRLGSFDAGFNLLNGSIPLSLRSWKDISTLVLSENHFTGGIPSFFSEFEKLSILQLGANLLGGEIPKSIGAWKNPFTTLNLSNNGLTGYLPFEIGRIHIERLYISDNNLTGSLTVLGNIPWLIEINVSNNNFSGPVPETLLHLLESSPSSFMGNPSLCVSCPLSRRSSCTANSMFKPCGNLPKKQNSIGKVKIAMIALGACIFFVLVVLGLVYLFLLRRKPKQQSLSFGKKESNSLLKKVLEATEHLSDQYIIGKGAHGTVYKAFVGPGENYAVKKVVYGGSEGGRLSICREIETIGKIRHRNLVKLEEFWSRIDHGLILYRYMQNGSLHDVLHETSPPITLKWSIRYNIAVGTANGLAYLHFDCDPAILHRDIKPTNILLDSEMEPYIADFGIAKFLDQSSASTSSTSVVGTLGYIAPENAFTTKRSQESDVYSYGVVLLELITRKKALDPLFREETDIVGWVRSIWSNGEEIDKIVDPSILDEQPDSHVMEQVVCVLQVALRCTEKEPRKRPTMREVVKLLVDAKQ